MVRVVSDSGCFEVEQEILRLADAVSMAGGCLDDRITVVCKDGALSIEAPLSVPVGTRLIKLPDSALLPVNEFKIAVQGDDCCLVSHSDVVTSAQIRIMEHLLNVYNLTGKIAFQRRTNSLRLARHFPELFSSLALPNAAEIYARKSRAEFDLETFFLSRQLGRGANWRDTKVTVLMPIMDLVNHHPRAQTYHDIPAALSISLFHASPENPECFVRYGGYDAHDMWLTFSYPDREAAFVNVRPMIIDLGEMGIINVMQSRKPIDNESIPAGMEDLGFFLPPMRYFPEASNVQVGFLRIPPSTAPRALRRVLDLLVSRLNPYASKMSRDNAVLEAERQAVDGTRSYYKEMALLLERADIPEDLEIILSNANEMVDIQLKLIDAYAPESHARARIIPVS